MGTEPSRSRVEKNAPAERGPASARVLIASDSSADAQQVLELLSEHFAQVSVSVEERALVRDFEAFQPDVLVLAFDTLEKAQQYCLGLYRLGQPLHARPHRLILLCRREELAAAFDLCKKQYFDDYVLYWPYASDGQRLPMCVWVAAREVLATRSQLVQRSSLLSQAQRLTEVEDALNREFDTCDRNVAAAHRSLEQLEQQLAGAADAFSQRLLPDARAGSFETVLTREIRRLKDEQASQTRLAGSRGLGLLTEWASHAKTQIRPALADARQAAERLQPRLLLMVVDDDEFTRDIISRAVDTKRYEVLGVADGAEALRALGRVSPDIILMDIQLPGMDGLHLTRCLKSTEQLAHIPIIMLTGDARHGTVAESVQAGAMDFLAKPFSREALMTKLQKACPSSQRSDASTAVTRDSASW